jgi:hypothetical protein
VTNMLTKHSALLRINRILLKEPNGLGIIIRNEACAVRFVFFSGYSFSQERMYCLYLTPSFEMGKCITRRNGRLGAMIYGNVDTETIR